MPRSAAKNMIIYYPSYNFKNKPDLRPVSVFNFIKTDFLKNAGKLFGSAAIVQVLNLLLITPLLARLFSKEQHGDLTVFTSIISVCVAFCTLKFEHATMVESNDEKAQNLISLSLFINLLFVCLFYLFLFLFGGAFASFMGFSSVPFWFYLTPPAIYFTAGFDIFNIWWNREKRYTKISSNRLLNFSSKSAYQLFHGFLFANKNNGLILGHILGQIISFVAYLPKNFALFLKPHVAPFRQLAKQYKSFAIWLTPSALINVLGTQLPVFIILMFFDRETNGLYGNALKLTYLPLTAVSFAISQVLYEQLARLKNNVAETQKLATNILRFQFFLAIIPVAVLVVWGDVLTPFLLGETWQDAGPMVQILALFSFAMYISSPFASAFEVQNRIHLQFVYTSLFTLLGCVGLYVSLHYFHNILGGLLVFTACSSIVRIAMLINCFHLLKTKIVGQVLVGLSLLAAVIFVLQGVRFYWG
ncbi:MAG: oligosaccharide flippase family protein [Flavobacteriales bacterium]|nr:oligosaccharide flippase family protein [Flavobacteriales bacterium]